MYLVLASIASGAVVTLYVDPHNPRLWVPVVVATVPLIFLGKNPWVCLMCGALLWGFVCIGAASVGMLYIPSALLMLVAAAIGVARRF